MTISTTQDKRAALVLLQPKQRRSGMVRYFGQKFVEECLYQEVKKAIGNSAKMATTNDCGVVSSKEPLPYHAPTASQYPLLNDCWEPKQQWTLLEASEKFEEDSAALQMDEPKYVRTMPNIPSVSTLRDQPFQEPFLQNSGCQQILQQLDQQDQQILQQIRRVGRYLQNGPANFEDSHEIPLFATHGFIKPPPGLFDEIMPPPGLSDDIKPSLAWPVLLGRADRSNAQCFQNNMPANLPEHLKVSSQWIDENEVPTWKAQQPQSYMSPATGY